MAKDKLNNDQLRIRELEQINISMQKELFKLRVDYKNLKIEMDKLKCAQNA